MLGCPAMTDIAHCPLYIESHVGKGRGCVDDMSRNCRVARGVLDFQQAILYLARSGVDYPGLLQSIKTVGPVQ